MSKYLIMCKSLTYAQRTARALDRGGVSSVVSRAPQKVSTGGCAYCVKISQNKLTDAMRVLKNAGLPIGKVYLLSSDESLSEVTP